MQVRGRACRRHREKTPQTLSRWPRDGIAGMPIAIGQVHPLFDESTIASGLKGAEPTYIVSPCYPSALAKTRCATIARSPLRPLAGPSRRMHRAAVAPAG